MISLDRFFRTANFVVFLCALQFGMMNAFLFLKSTNLLYILVCGVWVSSSGKSSFTWASLSSSGHFNIAK